MNPWLIGGILTAIVAVAFGLYRYVTIQKNRRNPGWRLLAEAQESEKNTQYTAAMKQYKQAEQSFRLGNKTNDMAKAVFFQALLYHRVKKYDEAMERFAYSVELCIQLGDSESRAHAYMKMADTCIMQKEYDEAETHYKKAIDIWKELEKENFQIYARYHLGLTEARHGKKKAAVRDIEQALSGYGKTLNLDALSAVLIEAAGIEEGLGATECAIKNLRQAEKYLLRLKDKEKCAAVRKKIAEINVYF